MKSFFVGIDIAKLTFVAAIKIDDKEKTKTFSNNENGYESFNIWLDKFSFENAHFCMESTGKYGNALALFLFNKNYIVSIVNPAKIKYFMKSQLTRNKTDSIDAKFIRNYCELFSPSAWMPLPIEIQELQAFVKRIDALNSILQQEQNRLEIVDEIVKKSIEKHIKYLSKEIVDLEDIAAKHIGSHQALKNGADLLKSIPGIGEKTINKTLAFFSNISNFDNAKKVAAFVGLNPQQFQSGTSLNHSHLSKTGSADLRKMLYMPALVAIRYEPSIKAFYEKLVGKGKPKKVAICAVMRKLIHIIYGVLKSQKMFDSSLV